VTEAAIRSGFLKIEKKLWIYTPAGFRKKGDRYPLLVVFDWRPKCDVGS
jgi:hypothetical protein